MKIDTILHFIDEYMLETKGNIKVITMPKWMLDIYGEEWYASVPVKLGKTFKIE